MSSGIIDDFSFFFYPFVFFSFQKWTKSFHMHHCLSLCTVFLRLWDPFLSMHPILCVCMLSSFSHVQHFATFPRECSLADSSVHEILQAKILEWVAMPSFRESSRPKDLNQVFCVSCNAGRFFIAEPPGKLPVSSTPYWKQQPGVRFTERPPSI